MQVSIRGWHRVAENIREVPYVVRIYTHYYNQGLSVHNCFRSSRKGVLSQIESGFSDGKPPRGSTSLPLQRTKPNEMPPWRI